MDMHEPKEIDSQMDSSSVTTVAHDPRALAETTTVDRCRHVLRRLLVVVPGVLGGVVAKLDGRAFADAFRPGHEVEAARIAAIASSLLALSESFSGETLAGKARYNTVVTDRGSILIVRIPSRTSTYLLCVWADNSENFAMALRHSLDTAEQLALAVDSGV